MRLQKGRCITETWLCSSIPDAALSLGNCTVIRNDRTSSTGGGVCIFINNNIYCKRLASFENRQLNRYGYLLGPKRLPRSISVILLTVIYHPTSAGHSQNVDLYSHISSNVDIFMQSHPDALVLVIGDFNYRSTRFSAKFIQRSTGLFQIVDVPTRENVTLDWCLTNCNNLFKSVQLPPLGSSDHNMILIKSHIPDNVKPDNTRIWKRTFWKSSLRPFEYEKKLRVL